MLPISRLQDGEAKAQSNSDRQMTLMGSNNLVSTLIIV